MDSRAYFELRERAERAAAKSAACLEARRIHQELAQSYAEAVRQLAQDPRENRCPRVGQGQRV